MGRSVRAGAIAIGVLCLTVAGCGSSAGSDASGGGGCDLVPIEAVQQQFPNYGIDKAEPVEAEGSSDACEYTGKPEAGAMGEYTDATTVTLTVGTYDDDADGAEAFDAATEDVGAEAEKKQGFEVSAAEGKAVAKFNDGTYAFSTIESPELDDPGDEQTIELLNVNR